jgi:hypothetical protein
VILTKGDFITFGKGILARASKKEGYKKSSVRDGGADRLGQHRAKVARVAVDFEQRLDLLPLAL